MQTKKENRGGVRTSLTKKIGRPNKEPTATIAFRVPANRKVEFQKLFREYLAFLLNGA